MGRFMSYNANPQKNRVGDCTVRAISKATGQDWETTYMNLALYGYMNADMPSANCVWGQYLRSKGFKRYIVDDHGNDWYTVADFCADNPKGVYVLALDSHVVCVVDGRYYDTWDSGNEIPNYYWTKVDDGGEQG